MVINRPGVLHTLWSAFKDLVTALRGLAVITGRFRAGAARIAAIPGGEISGWKPELRKGAVTSAHPLVKIWYFLKPRRLHPFRKCCFKLFGTDPNL